MKSKQIFFLFLNLVLLSSGLQGDLIEDVFSNIYNTAHWGRNQEGQGSSGDGSTIANTQVYRDCLQEFLKSKQIKSVVDFGCGDWEFSQLIDWNGIDYLGIDIVQSIIEKDQQKFSSPNITFFHANGLSIDLPEADLLICKDVLQHLSNEKIILFLSQIPKFKHCLITNSVNPYSLTSDNPDIYIGQYRFLDLTKPPFNIVGQIILTYVCDVTKQVLYIDNQQAPDFK
jgi:2-polyprenyl-3-methyl-5-hydroxy-6-metoxy-1,4-benzoquinol methylase